MRKNKNEILEYINNNLKDYEGYIQPIGKKIDKEHLFLAGEQVPNLDENELIYEAHFFNENSKKSVSIRQINDVWLVDETDLDSVNLDPNQNPDVQLFLPKFGNYKIRMAQIWIEKPDELCENLPVLKFQKVVFAGFIK